MSRRGVREAVKSAHANRSLADRVVEWLDPERAKRRMAARVAMAVAGQWTGGRTDRRQTKNWVAKNGSADQDMLWDLPTLRDRSRDLQRNNPLALGAVNTTVTSVVGTGLSLNSTPDARVLGWDDVRADAWTANTEAEFRAWAANPSACDAARTLDFYRMQALAFRSCLEAGDVFAILPMLGGGKGGQRLRVQLIEADRVNNPSGAGDSDATAGGVEKDGYGAPVAYHIQRSHPGGYSAAKREWDRVPAFGAKTGRRNVIHLYDPRRIGQSRGYPYLSPVLEQLKQLTDYTTAELTAAVVSGMFTVFIKTEAGGGLDVGAGNSDSTGGGEISMGSGAIVDLAAGEDVTFADPKRPNVAFDPFVQAILRQIGVALELPFELLIKHYTSSYTAARAAMLEAWRFFKGRRAFLAAGFCQPIYEAWMDEAVAMGRIAAPGYFDSPVIRAAYLAADWIGDAQGQVDPLREVQAARERIAGDLSNHALETMAIHGMPWEQVHKRLAKEIETRRADGTMPEPASAGDGAGGNNDAVQALVGSVVDGQARVAAAIAERDINIRVAVPESLRIAGADDLAAGVRESSDRSAAAIIDSAARQMAAAESMLSASESMIAGTDRVLEGLADVVAAVRVGDRN